MRHRKNKLGSLCFESLESRNLLAGISSEAINGLQTQVIDGTNHGDVAEVRIADDGQVEALLNGESTIVAQSEVDRIRFLGRSGNDSFKNFTEIDSAILGHGGDDELHGGDGNNWIQGGSGNDEIYGGDKNDQIRGRAGDDFINSGRRHDRVFGGDGDDVIVGGAGRDFIRGDAGDDTIFGGNSDDRINPGSGNDTIDFGNGNGRDIAILDFVEDVAVIGNSGQQLSVGNSNLSNNLTGGDVLRFQDVDRDAENYRVELNNVEQHSLNLLNALRESEGLNQLTLKADLSQFAETQVRNELVPLGANPTVRELFNAHSGLADIEHLIVDGRTLYLENISYLAPQDITDSTAASLVHEAFVNSPTHYSNMVNPDVREVGIGIIKNSNGWFVMHSFFG